ncbi:hypothetical protein BDW22DRAFT_1416929 [Trametopsis cervina]|nr:hypothetical protein BDW22DRAFT_1416929 [Trametopsis cervina]
MLEPLAASVITTVFSSPRQIAGTTSVQPLFKSMGRAVTSTLPHNFFNPAPRRSSKGKEKAGLDVHCVVCSKDGMSSGCVGSLATTSAIGEESIPCSAAAPRRHRARRVSQQRPMSDASFSHSPSFGGLPRQSQSLQRRHASSLPQLSFRRAEGDPHWLRLNSVIKRDVQHDMTEAWRSYEFVRLQGSLHAMAVPDLLVFAGKLADHAETGEHETPPIHQSWIQWGTRLQSVLKDVEPRLANASSQSALPTVWQCLMARALALIDHVDKATDLARTVVKENLHKVNAYHYIRMYQTFLLALNERQGPAAAIRLLIDERQVLQTYLPATPRSFPKEIVSEVSTFENVVVDVVRSLGSAEEFFGVVDYNRTHDWQRTAGAFLIRVFCKGDLPMDALAVHKAMDARDNAAPISELMMLVKSLAKQRSFELASSLYNTAGRKIGRSPENAVLYNQTGLYLYSRLGDPSAAQQCFDRIRQLQPGKISLGDVGLLIHAHAYNGEVQAAKAVFEKYLSSALHRPNSVHFTGIILAHARSGDLLGVKTWLGKMRDAGFPPDDYIHSIVLRAFAEHGDAPAVGRFLREMRNTGHSLSKHLVTSVIALLARKKDFRTAEEVFRQATEEGVVPDRQMITAVMNAYVEAGNWSSVVKTFDYLQAAARRKVLPMTIEVYNTLLKAHVLMGTPWVLMKALYKNMSETGVRPDAFTYSLLIQSACDNRYMEQAVRLYDEMEKRASSGQAHLRLNVYVLTILMAGWLKQSNREKATEVYNLMISQGIEPTSITFHHIIKAYANQRSQHSIQTALSFLEDIMHTSNDPSQLSTPRSIRTPLDSVYGPLLTAYAREKDPSKVEALLKEISQRGGEPTLGTLTALLDVYRRTGDLAGVKRVWPQIYRLGVAFSEAHEITGQPSKDGAHPLGHILCIPISIYIDALSSAGEHKQVADTWRYLKKVGATFDAGNWNQLVIALIRAGEPLRAFDVVQRVLLPNRQSAPPSRGHDEPKFPIPLDDESPGKVMPADGPSRDKGRRFANTRLEPRRRSYVMAKLQQAPYDFSEPLHTMSITSPVWSNSRVQPRVLSLLTTILESLEAGKSVKWIPMGGGRPVPRRPAEFEGKEYEDAKFVGLHLEYIKAHCPDALKVIREWKRRLPISSNPLPQMDPSHRGSGLQAATSHSMESRRSIPHLPRERAKQLSPPGAQPRVLPQTLCQGNRDAESASPHSTSQDAQSDGNGLVQSNEPS